MISYKVRINVFDWPEEGLMAALLLLGAIQIAVIMYASGNVVQKDMPIARLLDIERPATLAEK